MLSHHTLLFIVQYKCFYLRQHVFHMSSKLIYQWHCTHTECTVAVLPYAENLWWRDVMVQVHTWYTSTSLTSVSKAQFWSNKFPQFCNMWHNIKLLVWARMYCVKWQMGMCIFVLWFAGTCQQQVPFFNQVYCVLIHNYKDDVLVQWDDSKGFIW